MHRKSAEEFIQWLGGGLKVHVDQDHAELGGWTQVPGHSLKGDEPGLMKFPWGVEGAQESSRDRAVLPEVTMRLSFHRKTGTFNSALKGPWACALGHDCQQNSWPSFTPSSKEPPRCISIISASTFIFFCRLGCDPLMAVWPATRWPSKNWYQERRPCDEQRRKKLARNFAISIMVMVSKVLESCRGGKGGLGGRLEAKRELFSKLFANAITRILSQRILHEGRGKEKRLNGKTELGSNATGSSRSLHI